jgi:transcription antitermination protein NusB
MGLRHQGRELALKALYRIDICGECSREDIAAFLAELPGDDRARAFAAAIVAGVRGEREQIDKCIADALENWSIARLARVDHNIMRIALYELLRLPDIPARVTIDEAIELAKRYGDQDSGRFVNGVIDQVADRLGLKYKGEEQGAIKHG